MQFFVVFSSMTLYSSDAAALEAAGKKEVLKVNFVECPSLGKLVDPQFLERMELLGPAWDVGMYALHLGSNECLVRGCFPQWRSSFSRLWFHRVGAGDSLHRWLIGGDGFNVRVQANDLDHSTG